MSAYFSAREAADYCGVSEKTIRNWLASGKVSAEKSAGTFRIPQEQLEPLKRKSAQNPQDADWNAEQKEAEVRDEVRTESAEVIKADQILELVRDLQEQLIAKAESAAMWQARADMLAGELGRARQKIELLEAPKVEPENDQAAIEKVAISQANTVAKRSWWRFWERG